MKKNMKTLVRGFALIEALVAMLVVSFGMLAVAGFQINLSLSSDVAKQRTEATRLAQEKLEALRSFANLTIYTANMVSKPLASAEKIDTIAGVKTNTEYSRYWGITSAIANSPDTGRSIFVTVAWTDRAGNAQEVQLYSHISATDPTINGSLFFPLPDGTILRRPKNRNIDIPIPATSILGTGKSFVPWSGSSGGFLIFSDTSGDIVQKCTDAPTAENLSNCEIFDGYLLTGYITGTASKVALVTKIKVPFGSAEYISGTPECSVDQAYDQTTAATLPGIKYYACLIQPIDHDENTNTPRIWSGRVDLAGATSASLAGTQVCRFSSNENTTVNSEHPAIYKLVDRSLDNQNFYISSNCADTSASRVLHFINTGTSTLSITYNGNGQTSGSIPIDDSAYTSGSEVTVLSAGTLVKDNATFEGWNTAVGGSGSNYAPNANFFITEDTILYAKWSSATIVDSYRVTYNSNGGTGTVPGESRYLEGSSVTILTTPTPIRSYYKYLGWSRSLSGEVETTFTMPASDTTLYAQWAANVALDQPKATWTTTEISWISATNATGYKVRTCSVSTSSSCIPDKSATSTIITSNSYSIPKINGNTKLCINIISIDSTNKYPDSIPTETKCFMK